MAALTSSPVVLPALCDPPASPQQVPSSAPPSIVQHCPLALFLARSLAHSAPVVVPSAKTCQHDRAQTSSTSASFYSSSNHNNNFDLDEGGRCGAPIADSVVSHQGCLWIKKKLIVWRISLGSLDLCHGMDATTDAAVDAG